MKTDRRSFLRLFGASTAAVATMEGVETVTDSTAPTMFAADVRGDSIHSRFLALKQQS